MKKNSNIFINMVYPMLISLFLYCFTTAFVKNSSLESLQLISIILTFVFGIMFVIGLIFEIIHLFKSRKEK